MRTLINRFFIQSKNFKQFLAVAPKKAAVLAVRAYQSVLSSFLGGNCRYFPSCSEYSVECFERLPFHQALGSSIRRILSCHPFGGSGFDPIPKSQGHK